MTEKSSFAENDPSPATRQQLLDEARSRHDYNYDFGFALSTAVQPEDKADVKWTLRVLRTLYEVRANVEKYLAASGKQFTVSLPKKSPREIATMLAKKDMTGLVSYYLADLGPALPSGRPQSLEDYKAFFVSKNFPMPAIANDIDLEEQFGEMFLQGADPTTFYLANRLPQNFPVPADVMANLTDFAGDSLEDALRERRAFLADYRELSHLKDGQHPQGPKFVSCPLALLVRPRNKSQLLGVAIQCDQDPQGNPIFTPADKSGWKVAKLFVRAAHGARQEVVSHLGNTHLLIEPIVLATYRNLSIRHPLSYLLKPHFAGTLPINSLAVKTLIPPGKAVDRVIGATSPSTYEQIAASRLSHDFKSASLPMDLQRRGVDRADVLPSYPYRDDGILVWNAISRWVESYLRQYYKSDGDVTRDSELANWARDISTRGKIKNFTLANSLTSLSELIDITTTIIWTASAQHAAVNFGQKTDMIFCPAGPLATFIDAPRSKQLSEQDYLDALPPLDVALKTTGSLYFLGSVISATLGNYQSGIKPLANYFPDREVDPFLGRFKAELAAAEKAIQDHNQGRRRPYIHMLPSRIPMSINI